VIVAALLWYWPTLETRLFEPGRDLKTVAIDDVGVDFSGRDDIWEFYFEEFTFSPLFGRGMGAGFVAAADWVPCRRKTPTTSTVPAGQHRRRRVLLCAAAIFVWYRNLLRAASDNDRSFLIALLPALGVFAITEDILVFPTGLALSPDWASCSPSARPRHPRARSGYGAGARAPLLPSSRADACRPSSPPDNPVRDAMLACRAPREARL
jgi:hypothetical protein